MNEEFSEYQQKLEGLIQKVNEASREKDYQRVVLLKDDIEKLLKSELETKINALRSEYEQKQQEHEGLIQKVNEASREKDYQKAAQLKDKAHLLEPDLAELKEQEAQKKLELTKLEEQITRRQSKLVESKEHIVQLQPQFLEAEINFEIGRRNFVRAVMLAEQHQYPPEFVQIDPRHL